MHKTIIALTALAAATAGHAAVPLNFNSVPGNSLETATATRLAA